MPADPKPDKRIREPAVFNEFYSVARECVCCRIRRGEAHHLIYRSQGGDDVMANLVPLCSRCHDALHGNPWSQGREYINYVHVKHSLAQLLRSEAGADQAAYLIRKLGPFGAEDYVLKLEQA